MIRGSDAGRRRLNHASQRRLIFLFAVLVAGAVLAVAQLILQMEIYGQANLLWIYGIIAYEAVVLVVFFLHGRSREIKVSDFEQRLASRTREQATSKGGWLLAVFDNGLILQGQRQGAIVGFYFCYDSDRQRYTPTMAEIQRYMRGTGVMKRVRTVSVRKADATTRSMLEQLNRQLGTRWMVLQLLRRKPNKRPTVKAPSWIVGGVCYWSRWSLHPGEVLNGVDTLAGFLDSAQRQVFTAAMTGGIPGSSVAPRH